MQESEVKIKSLQKALLVLECFTVETPELGITEISEKLDLYKSNVHNIISTFERCGYIAQNPQTGKYRLDLKILERAFVINSSLGLHGIVHPFMTALSEEVGESVYFALPKDEKIIYLEGAYPTSTFMARSMVGEKAEMYCTALGKSILSNLPEREYEWALAHQSMKPFTGNTITERDALIHELIIVRKRGYSIDNMEHEHGIRCVSVPVFRRNRTLLGAISISGPSPRIEDELIPKLVEKLTACADQISLRL